MTSAVSGLSAALYRDDPDAVSVAFTNLALSDSGDHLTFQAAPGSRYWDEDMALTVKVDGTAVTTGFAVNYLRGSVTFETSKSGSAVTVTGARRSEANFQKVIGLFDGKLKIGGKEIDTTSCDDTGWGSSIMGAGSWEFSAGTFYYDGGVPLADLKLSGLWKFYSVDSITAFAIGIGTLQGIENILASASDAQKQTLTVKGQGEIYPE